MFAVNMPSHNFFLCSRDMHNKRKMYLPRLTALKLRYDVDECYDLVFPLDHVDLETLSHAV